MMIIKICVYITCLLPNMPIMCIHNTPIFSLIVSPEGSIETTPPEINSERGETQTFSCSAMGGPANVFSWIRLLDNVTVSQEAALMVLVDSARNGSEYICTVMNGAGSDSARVILRGECNYTCICFPLIPVLAHLYRSPSYSCCCGGRESPGLECQSD